MPSFTNLTLDTQAPVVTWGTVEDAEADFELRVGYTLNEPGITSAEVRLADGRVLAMEVQATYLAVQLPADAPNGATEVRAYVRDDVWNTAVRTLTIFVVGVEGPPPVVPTGLPSPPQHTPRRVVDEPSICRAVTDDVVRAVVYTPSRLRTRTFWRAPDQRAVRHTSRARATTASDRLSVTVVTLAGRGAGSSADAIWRRPEGPRAEEDIIALLDLL